MLSFLRCLPRCQGPGVKAQPWTWHPARPVGTSCSAPLPVARTFPALPPQVPCTCCSLPACAARMTPWLLPSSFRSHLGVTPRVPGAVASPPPSLRATSACSLPSEAPHILRAREPAGPARGPALPHSRQPGWCRGAALSHPCGRGEGKVPLGGRAPCRRESSRGLRCSEGLSRDGGGWRSDSWGLAETPQFLPLPTF